MAERKGKPQLMALWRQTSNNGTVYYTGRLGEVPVIAFENTDKRNEKEPDLRVYVQEPKPAQDEDDLPPF